MITPFNFPNLKDLLKVDVNIPNETLIRIYLLALLIIVTVILAHKLIG
jgi:hypothetical protein